MEPTQEQKIDHFQDMAVVMGQRVVSSHASHIFPYLKPDSKILDVGCSIGSITIDMAKKVPNGHVIGIDIDEKSLNNAREFAKAAGVTNVTFQVGNATDLSEFDSDFFDIVHSHQVLLHIPPPGPITCLKEMRRVAKPSGGIVATRDSAELIYVGGTENMDNQRLDFWEQAKADMHSGRKMHMWAHEAGYSWDQIESGSAGWEMSGIDGRKRWAQAATVTSRAFLEKGIALRDKAFYDQLEKDFEAWVEDPAGRVMALDGWVVAKK